MRQPQLAERGAAFVDLVRPGPSGRGPKAQFHLADAQAIRDRIAGVRAVAPARSQNVSAVYLKNDWTTRAVGSTPDYFGVANWKIREGRAFDEAD